MATSLAAPEPAGYLERDSADSQSPGRRISRWFVLVLLLAVAGLAISTPALAATNATNATQVSHAAHQPATLTANLTPALPSGVCQVPGIGDIGGLVGLCAQGSSGIVG